MRRSTVPHLWRHPKGNWYIVWQENGRPRRRSTGTPKRVPAERALRQFILQQEADAAWGSRPDITMHEAALEWLDATTHPRNGLAPVTVREYRTIADRVLEFFSPRALARDITPADVRSWLAFLEDQYGLSPQGLRKRLGRLSMIFRFHIREGNLGRNPAEAVRPPRAPHRRTPAMTEEQFADLLADLDRDLAVCPPSQRWARQGLKDALVVLWLSGLRSIELLRLTWDDIDLRRALWTIRSPREKGGHRVEPIHSEILPILERRRGIHESRPFTEREVQKEWKWFKQRWERWAGTSLHSLRHSFVTRLARLGNPSVTKYLAGHHTDQMSDHYTHLGPEDARPFLEDLSLPG